MEALLQGDQVILESLRNQFRVSSVTRREMTGVGFFTFFDVPNTAGRAPQRGRMVIHDVEAAIGGLHHGAGFALLVVDGTLHQLEGFSYDEPWPSEVGDF
jgi:hypothetical protein